MPDMSHAHVSVEPLFFPVFVEEKCVISREVSVLVVRCSVQPLRLLVQRAVPTPPRRSNLSLAYLRPPSLLRSPLRPSPITLPIMDEDSFDMSQVQAALFEEALDMSFEDLPDLVSDSDDDDFVVRPPRDDVRTPRNQEALHGSWEARLVGCRSRNSRDFAPARGEILFFFSLSRL